MSYVMRDAAVRTLRLINGEQEIGRSLGFWIATLVFIICLIALPKFVSGYALLNYSYILSTVFLALGLCLIWGFAGILSLANRRFSVSGDMRTALWPSIYPRTARPTFR